MTWGPFLLCSCQEVLLRGFSELPYLTVPFFWKRNHVWPPVQQVGQAVTHGRQTGKNAHIFPPESIQPLRYGHTSLVRFAIPRFQTSPFFFSYRFQEIFLKSASTFVYLHFYVFQWAASVSLFRSGRKSNSEIGRKCKVKPPVFSKNLQPFG